MPATAGIESIKTKHERGQKEHRHDLQEQQERLLALELQISAAAEAVTKQTQQQQQQQQQKQPQTQQPGDDEHSHTQGTSVTVSQMEQDNPQSPQQQQQRAIPKATIDIGDSGDEGARAAGSDQFMMPQLQNQTQLQHVPCTTHAPNNPPGDPVPTTHNLRQGQINVGRNHSSNHDNDHKNKKQAPFHSARDIAILFVKAFVVSQLLGFDIATSPDVQTFLQACAVQQSFLNNNEDNSSDGHEIGNTLLSPAKIKHHVAELYAATKDTFAPTLLAATMTTGVARAPPTFLHVTLPVWTTNATARRRGRGGVGRRFIRGHHGREQVEERLCIGDDEETEGKEQERYVGLRVYWLSAAFEFCSALLAVKRFDAIVGCKAASYAVSGSRAHPRSASETRPPKEPHEEGGACANGDGPLVGMTSSAQNNTGSNGGGLTRWAAEVLGEYGISTERVFSTVTDTSDHDMLAVTAPASTPTPPTPLAANTSRYEGERKNVGYLYPPNGGHDALG